MDGPRVGKRGAVAGDIGRGLFKLQLQVAEIGRVLQQHFGLDEGRRGFLMAVDDARARLIECRAPARQLAAGLFGLGQRIAGRIQPVLSVASSLARVAFGLACLAKRLLGPC